MHDISLDTEYDTLTRMFVLLNLLYYFGMHVAVLILIASAKKYYNLFCFFFSVTKIIITFIVEEYITAMR